MTLATYILENPKIQRYIFRTHPDLKDIVGEFESIERNIENMNVLKVYTVNDFIIKVDPISLLPINTTDGTGRVYQENNQLIHKLNAPEPPDTPSEPSPAEADKYLLRRHVIKGLEEETDQIYLNRFAGSNEHLTLNTPEDGDRHQARFTIRELFELGEDITQAIRDGHLEIINAKEV